MSRYKVMVDDNFHYMDRDERYERGIFLTADEAVGECKRIVDSSLEGFLKPGITAAELYDIYTSFGDDPFVARVDSNAEPVHFSAWNYARERSDVLTSPDKTDASASGGTAREKFIRELSSNPRFKEAPKSGQGIEIVGAKPFKP
jgi:hypothetical protein